MVTVTAPEYTPWVSPDGFTETATAPGIVPVEAPSISQPPPLAVRLTPAAVPVIESDWAGGVEAPMMWVNVSDAGVTASGGPEVITRVTGKVWKKPEDVLEMVTLPV